MAAVCNQSPTLLGRFRAFFSPPQPSRAIEARRVDPGSIGRGFADPRHGSGNKRIVVTTDEALFEAVRAHAVKHEISLAAAVRLLVERGLSASKTP